MNTPQLSTQSVRSDSLAEFCRRTVEDVRDRVHASRINVDLDVDPTIRLLMNESEIGARLSALVEDACRAMPAGGQLDLTAILGADKLEIEVADSRSDGAAPLSSAVWARRRASIQLQQTPCPQGGLARTMVIAASEFRVLGDANSERSTSSDSTSGLRRAA